jgi:aspartate-semialdehyde dehydrogenase
MKKSLCMAVVGALGAVGREMIAVLEDSGLDVGTLKPLDVWRPTRERA